MSLQTLAGCQTALSQIVNPRLGGPRLTEASTGVVDEALARVDLSGRTTRVARSVLAQTVVEMLNRSRAGMTTQR